MKEKINYQEAVAIDPDRLDEEIFSQPGYYMKFSEIVATLNEKKARLKRKLEIVEARLDYKVRTNPERFKLNNLKSITEPTIRNTIQNQKKVQKLKRKIIKIEYDLDISQAAITALDHKKKMLEKAVDLYNGQYFSPIKKPKLMKGGKRIYYESINREMNKALNRRRREKSEQV